jgi:Tfp pilus assembly protein PilE
MISFGKKGQGEGLIKLLVVAIIAIIALALAKSYFREASKTTQKTVEEVFQPATTGTSASVSPPLSFFSVPVT